MKATNIIQLIGYIALFVASSFNLVNSITEKQIFPPAVTVPLLAIALVGIGCGIVILVKNKRK